MNFEGSTVGKISGRENDIAVLRAEYGLKQLKKGIWVYFLLLLFEGALRKWFLPGLATPLLIIRDPVAAWLLYTAWRYDQLPSNLYLFVVFFCGILGFFTTMLIGHGNFVVAMYGERIWFLHFPIMFLIGKIFDREDVIKLGKLLLWIAIPMVVIIALQFYTPQSSFINRGIGGDDAGSGFSGANGYFRPSGTFSFTTGNTEFFCVVAVFVIYFWFNAGEIKKTLLWGSSMALLIAIPLSISRTLSFQIALTLLFAVVPVVQNPKNVGKVVGAAFGVIIMFIVLSQVGLFKNAVETLTARFTDANESEGGIANTLSNRTIAGVDEPFQSADFPFFGMGIGMGTNAGARLLTGRSDRFLVSEGEWGRLIGEMGSVLGTTVLFTRIAFCLQLVLLSYKKLKVHDILPWLLFSVSFQIISQGQWAQPTALGFAILCGGLTISSLRNTYEVEEVVSEQ
jgi:hypothetical protein